MTTTTLSLDDLIPTGDGRMRSRIDNGIFYQTNSVILFWRPADDDDEEVGRSLPDSVLEIAARHAKVSDWIPLANASQSDAVDCGVCNATGCVLSECEECDGTGEDECEHCGRSDDCDYCDGFGYYRTSRKCPCCEGDGRAHNLRILGRLLNHKYMPRLLTNDARVGSDSGVNSDELVFLKVGDVDGALMPLLVDE